MLASKFLAPEFYVSGTLALRLEVLRSQFHSIFEKACFFVIRCCSRTSTNGHQTAVPLRLYSVIERFSFECRKVIGFAFTTLSDWFKKLAPLFHPIRSKTKTKTNRDSLVRVFPHFASATCNCFVF